MATRKAAKVMYADSPSQSMRDYQCEEDVRNLQRAAEVMADTGRRRKAMKSFRKQQQGGNKLLQMLGGKSVAGY